MDSGSYQIRPDAKYVNTGGKCEVAFALTHDRLVTYCFVSSQIKRFRSEWIQKEANHILREYLLSKNYDPRETGKWSQDLTDLLLNKASEGEDKRVMEAESLYSLL